MSEIKTVKPVAWMVEWEDSEYLLFGHKPETKYNCTTNGDRAKDIKDHYNGKIKPLYDTDPNPLIAEIERLRDALGKIRSSSDDYSQKIATKVLKGGE